MLSCFVGLALLGIAERALLDGGTIGASGPVGSQKALPKNKTGATPTVRALPQRQDPARPAGGAPAAPAPDTQALTAQVRQLTLAERGGVARQAYGTAATGQPLVNATRISPEKTWVFGTTAIPVPASSPAIPDVAFFAARWVQNRWQVALSGSAAFGNLVGAMPANLMSPVESQALRKYGAITAEQATAVTNGTRAGDGLMLPWKIGASWSMAAEKTGASARPLGTLAFSGGDGRVLAAAGGRLYRFCGDGAGNAMAMVIHPSGLATTYYQLTGLPQLRDGSVVKRGDVLGRTGVNRPCGGAAAARPQVEFGVRRGAEEVLVDGAQIGGWTFRERAQPLLGFAERGVLQVLPGGLLANLGPVSPADAPPAQPSPSATPGTGAGAGATPKPSATQKRSPSAGTQQ